MKWIKKWLTGRAQRVVISGSELRCRPVASRVSQGSVLGPVLFNISIKNLNEWIDSTHSKSAELPFSEMWTGWKAGQRSFNRGKCRVLYLGKNNYTDQRVT